MIKLQKFAEPQYLIDNRLVWEQELNVGDETHAGSYGHRSIKSVLISETNGKCAYCESKVLHIAYGDVEHVCPKNPYPSLRFERSNLTLACDVCNTKKGQHTDLFDPYASDPEESFIFVGAFMAVRNPADSRATRTVQLLKLNRPQLLERRQERVKNLDRQRHEVSCCSDVALQAVLMDALINEETSALREYAACARSYIRLLDDRRASPFAS